MASGFGAKGSEGRCYPLWQGFSKVFIIFFFVFFFFFFFFFWGEREIPFFFVVGKENPSTKSIFTRARLVLLTRIIIILADKKR